MGLTIPEQAPYLIYGAIVLAAVIAVFVIFRDGLFFHLEGGRLRADGEMINRHTKGPGKDKDPEKSGGFLKSFGRHKKKPVFRSKLLQIHYQNILRTFEQGNRRAWVYQDASITDIETLLSQRGMKLAWTLIEVLPQMGLIGTLIGLSTMFFAFRASSELPELSIVSGFGTALGTTILANLFVLILRPLHMQNERSMAEILSNLQMLMAMFILPTQQAVLERSPASPAYGRSTLVPPAPVYASGTGDARLSASLDELTRTLAEFTDVQSRLESGAMAKETSEVAQQTASIATEVRGMLRTFQESIGHDQITNQQRAFTQLTEAIQGLARSMAQLERKGVPTGAAASTSAATPGSERIEHDLTQLRLLTHDTLLLLEQIASQLGRLSGENRRLLSDNRTLRAKLFPEQPAPATPAPTEAERATGEEPAPVRLFKERG
jgi:hypothetical protein